MDELYRMMKAKLDEMYALNEGSVTFDSEQFFKLYKLVCDMKRIQDIVGE